MSPFAWFACFLVLFGNQLAHSLRYEPAYEQHNLNQNNHSDNPIEYDGLWADHDFFPSPKNWRFPFYTLFLDRFVNGNPSNDNGNDTLFEQDIYSTQFRHGGDIQGMIDSLDYIQGMGIKGIYVAGSPFINQPWQYDSYSPLDMTLLDFHFGNIQEWRQAVDEIHNRGMYVILDNTIATMGDLLGFEGYLNESTPFDTEGYEVVWKSSREYRDFHPTSNYSDKCEFPRFWGDNGYEVGRDVYNDFQGCYDGDFDQFGDTEGFGVYPPYRRQLTKFASVQDRLREWAPSVRERLQRFSCIAIQMLDIDGYRYDKATQVTVDATGNFSASLRECARGVGKDNFFLTGEITSGNNLGSVYLGRGREPDNWLNDLTEAASLTLENDTDVLRTDDQSGLDSAAFHYSVYRYLTRFLGMSGNLEAGYDLPSQWVESWYDMLLTNDLVNVNTGVFDPRHMYGTANQDVFRWPSIEQGVERFLLGQFITTLVLPGIPLLLWGEEVGFYVLDSTADNYIFGRQSMSSSPAWYMHGCYTGGSTQYHDIPLEPARHGCHDVTNSWDHRDPAHPLRNIIRTMYQLREKFEVLQDGYFLGELSKHTEFILYPGSNETETETGLWSVRRAAFEPLQKIPDESDIWMVYHNRNESFKYTFDCSSNDSAIIAPYDSGTKVRNLLSPFDEIELIDAPKKLRIYGSESFNGCVEELELAPFEFRAYVPVENHVSLAPMITKFEPGHDTPVLSNGEDGALSSVNISFHFSKEMDCRAVNEAISFTSSTGSSPPAVDWSTVKCNQSATNERPQYPGGVVSAWSWSATLRNVSDGIHQIVVKDAESAYGREKTGSTDRFLLRIGKDDNPIVHPLSGNYSTSLLSADQDGQLKVHHNAAGADQWRYSLNWGSSWSDWRQLDNQTQNLDMQPWSGTDDQAWMGHHVMVQYWSKLLGSSSFMQQGDVDFDHERRFPHMFANGPFNKYGYDVGLQNKFDLDSPSNWGWHYMDEWPAKLQLNVWGINPDGKPDQSFVYGDMNGDGVLDRPNPSSLLENAINVTNGPSSPHLAYRISFNDGNLKYELVPTGNRWVQMALYVILWVAPLLTGLLAVFVFMGSFYKVKYVKRGIESKPVASEAVKTRVTEFRKSYHSAVQGLRGGLGGAAGMPGPMGTLQSSTTVTKRRTVLIATIEYNIDDWEIKVKIGGLGVMAQLMGKSLGHQDIVWVVPCVGGIDYPDIPEERAEAITVTILGQPYLVDVHYHQLGNVTFVLLDAPIFRQTTKANPYPDRMDDMESAVYYSTWNQCISQAMKRFSVDLYHINDYHGAAAPLYLLPNTVPCCLSLHNAEFQGMWPMRTADEREEVGRIFNLPHDVVKKYVQFGSVFNLLHAGASYLRRHQSGYGAVGVSKKYGDRSFARYPIFWGLSQIGQLPNPDPSDIAEWDKTMVAKKSDVEVDQTYETDRGELRMQAQAWAGLAEDPNADLFVFVGRWSEQKGVDLIADIFPGILEQYPKSQLICVGPIIDLHGKFAALKLSKLMDKYPRRVFSRPEFTVLPPCIHTGAEFALIPSRDEPFGLVAVEFGRKGALGVGARVGGLGQMPGWWYTIESTSTKHLLSQFKQAIVAALDSKKKERALMRAWSAKQRFPVAQWLEGLEKLQRRSMKMHDKVRTRNRKSMVVSMAPSDNFQIPTAAPSPTRSEASRPGSADGRSMSVQMLGLPRANSGPNIPSLAGSGVNTPSRVDSDAESISAESSFGSAASSALPSRVSSVVNLSEIVGERKDFALQQVDPFFTDARGQFYAAFEQKLAKLNAANSTTELCIEEYLVKSERQWFERRHDAKIGSTFFSQSNSSNTLQSLPKKQSPLAIEVAAATDDDVVAGQPRDAEKRPGEEVPEFYFGENYVPPTGLRKWLQVKLGTWPVYSFLLALGQIIASNSYQMTLLTGEVGESANKLYSIASVYLGFSIVWGLLSRHVRLLYVLTTPFFLYGCAFIIIGASPFVKNLDHRFWMQNIATGVYSAASASGALFFAYNFGDEGGAPITTWIWRACCIQGVQHAYTIALWFWGSFISSSIANGDSTFIHLKALPVLFPVTMSIAVVLWGVGLVLFLGLPDYYRQMPDQVPMLYKSVLKRKTVCWFIVAVVLQNYFLSTQYGRNWFFLFSSKHLSVGTVLGLAAFFFFGVWAVMLGWFAFISKRHPWWLPLFALGLGAPRWAQMLWGTSSFGLYLPWLGGSAVKSAIFSRSLWLWLGLLDAVQSAGIGMMLMVTLTRVHVSVAMVASQVVGSVATMVARATAPNRLGPGDVFPDLSRGVADALGRPWFWIGLIAQLVVCAGFFKFFRKEQISKP